MFVFLATKEYKKKTKNHDTRLSKREFRDLVHRIVELMVGADVFDYFVEFMLNSVEVSLVYHTFLTV